MALFQPTPPPPDDEPVIGALGRLEGKGLELRDGPDVSRTALEAWVASVRICLARLYGKEASQLRHFPPVRAAVLDHRLPHDLGRRLIQLRRFIESLEPLLKLSASAPQGGKRIFIGHGRSLLWRQLKDFIADRLSLQWDEFNREPAAGYTTSERLGEMMEQAGFALVVMTAEEALADATLHARANVIHEVGLFQGRLGLRRAIVMLEDGCSEFSNIVGLTQLRFPKGDIAARFEDVRRVLEREGLV